METKHHLTLIVTIAAAAALLAFLLIGRPFVRHLQDTTHPFDGGKNYNMARVFAEQGVLSDSLAPPFPPTARRVPLYSLFLAGIIKTGTSPVAALGIQFILSLLVPVIVYGIGRRLVSPHTGFLAGLVMAVHPTQMAMPSTFDDVWFFEIFWLGGFLMFIRALAGRQAAAPAVASAVLFGLSGLIRPLTMTLWPLLVLGFFIRYRYQAARMALAFFAVLALLWTPWFYRNWHHFHRIFITTQDAYILTWDSYAYYAADRDGVTRAEVHNRIIADLEARTGRKLPHPEDKIEDPYLNDPELAALTKRYVWEHVRSDLFGFTVSYLRHGLPLWTGSALREFLATAHLYPEHLLASLPVFTREAAVGNWPAVRAGLITLGPWAMIYALDALLFLVLLYGFCAIGWWRLIRSGNQCQRTVAFVLLFLVVVATLVSSGVYIGPRYRFPFEPLIWILALYGLFQIKKRPVVQDVSSA